MGWESRAARSDQRLLSRDPYLAGRDVTSIEESMRYEVTPEIGVSVQGRRVEMGANSPRRGSSPTASLAATRYAL